MTIKSLLPPFANRYNLYKLINPLLRKGFTYISPQNFVRSAIIKHKTKYLNLGGYRPVENYLSIQLSPVELYGIPTIKQTTTVLGYDETTGEINQEQRFLSAPALSLHFDILNGLPLDSDYFSGINMSHILEHFTREEGLKVLKECYRVLESKGVLRISCPDLLVYAKAYVNRDSSFFGSVHIQKACCYEGLTTYGDLFISKAYDNENGHKWFYDAESTIQILHEAGFSEAEEKKVHESNLPHIESVEPYFRSVESFYVEAIK